MKSPIWQIVLVSLTVAILSGQAGCKSEEDENRIITNSATTDTGTAEIATTFTDSGSQALSASIIDLPSSLQVSGSSQSIGNRSYAESGDASDDSDSGGSFVGIYSGIRHYIGMAEMMKDFLKEFMTEIVKSDLMQTATLNTEISIPAVNQDEGGPKKFKIEQPTGETYKWKLSLYFSDEATSPDMIIRFDITDDTARGRLLGIMTETDEDLVSADITALSISRYVDVTFDGTSNNKTLDVKMVQDLSAYEEYARSNWSTLTDAQKSALDLGQPAKVLVSASKDVDTGVFTIYGTSYHSGWSVQSTLEGEDMMWGEGRTMYMFKAKADETAQGAKLYLSIPLESRTDASADVWEEDDISSLFTDMMLNQVNSMLARLSDNIDDPDTDGEDGANASVAEEQRTADMIFAFFIYPPLTEPHTYTQAEYDAAKAYYASDQSIRELFENLPTLASFNQYILTLDLDGPEKEGVTYQQGIWFIMNVAQADARADSAGSHALTQEELAAFVARDAVSQTEGFKRQYESISYLINPAFYSDTSGFLGTWDAATDVFYAYDATADTLSVGDKSMIADLKDLDLSNITSHIPSEVKAAAITIE
jgi:hypothetical protein